MANASLGSAQQLQRQMKALKAFRVQEEPAGRKPRSLVDLTRSTLYVRYKECNRRIENVVTSLVPPDIYQPQIHGVNGIIKAVDYIVERDLDVPRGLFNDLKESIRDRRNMAVHEYRGGDSGHAHVVEVLEYCWVRLEPLRKAASRDKVDVNPPVSNQDTDMSALENQFEKLGTECGDDDTDSDTDDEMDLPQGPRPRPSLTKETALSIHESLLSDRADISSFLNTMEQLMELTAQHFKLLVKCVACIQKAKLPSSTIIERIMEASVAANIAIQQVAALEHLFVEEHPHLNTPYRMFATYLFHDAFNNLESLVAAKSPLASQFTAHDAIAFLGDAVEDVFRYVWDPKRKSLTLVPQFLSKWQFKDDALTRVDTGEFLCVGAVVQSMQVLCASEVARPDELPDHVKKFGDMMNMPRQVGLWMPGPYTEENRSMSTTFRHLQCLSTIKGKIYAKECFGVLWGERAEPATRIQFDMDELLMHEIMPSLYNMCADGLMSTDLPHQDELFPGIVHIRSMVKYPDRPVSWSLAFTVHTILTSIIETQECSQFLAQTAQLSFLTFVQQVNTAEKTHAQAKPWRPPHWDDNFNILQNIRFLSHMTIQRTREQMLLSVWNPYCAGSLLLYVAYYGNLEGGAWLVNSVGEFQCAMHLINALQQVGAVRLGEVEVLDGIFSCLKDCPTFWKGSLPIQGQFKLRWMKGPPFTSYIGLADLSKSFQSISLLDFQGVEWKSHGSRKRPKKRHPLYRHMARINTTLDAILDESELLATNLISLAGLLNDFYVGLFNVLGLMPMVEAVVREVNEGRRLGYESMDQTSWDTSAEYMTHKAKWIIFGDFILKGIDDGNDEMIASTAALLKRTFEECKPASHVWFLLNPKPWADME